MFSTGEISGGVSIDLLRDVLIEWGYHSPEVWRMSETEVLYVHKIGEARRAARTEIQRQSAIRSKKR